jgi:hypothetical protein
MSDTASATNDYQTIETASTEGLDLFFSENALDAPLEQPGTANGTASQNKAMPGIASGISVDQAAKLLGISGNAVIKRLNKGKLRGFKIPGQYGQKWIVDPSCLPAEAIEIHLENCEEQPGQSREQPLEQSGSAFGTASFAQAMPGTSEGIASESLKVLAQVIQTQNAQLQAQNDLVKHLTTEIKERDHQLKLLTDSQHKGGWWAKFSSWFFKGK